MSPTRDRCVRTAGGFTLIELLVVIGVVALLMVVLLPQIVGARQRGAEVETQARIQHLVQACAGYERKLGIYPPADFRGPEGVQAKGTADETNAGIESCMIFLHQKAMGLVLFEDKEDWLANTDGDSNSAVIPLLERKAKVEVVDAWGTPLAYFVAAGYGRSQKVRMPSGETVSVAARKNPNTSGYFNSKSFQIISAGADLQFNTDDDVTYPD